MSDRILPQCSERSPRVVREVEQRSNLAWPRQHRDQYLGEIRRAVGFERDAGGDRQIALGRVGDRPDHDKGQPRAPRRAGDNEALEVDGESAGARMERCLLRGAADDRLAAEDVAFYGAATVTE